jgi:type IX secretion system PorP/SprF family membrane protein
MKLKFILPLVLLLTQLTIAQEGIAVYSDYLSDNYYLLHPSMAGSSNCAKIRLTSRQQWNSQPESPRLQTLSFNMGVGERSGIGAIVFNDRNGYHSQKGFKLTYAHHLPLNNGPDLNQLSFGVSAGLIQSNLDETKFSPIYDPITQSGAQLKDSYFNIDMGLSYQYNNFYTHATVKNMVANRRQLYTDIESDNLRKYLISTGYIFGETELLQVEPSILFQLVEKTQESFVDFNIKLYKKLNESKLWGGISYRRSIDGATYGNNNSQKLQNLIPILGINYKNVMFAYTYTSFVGNIQFASGGFHQITLGLDLFCRKPRYDCFCPAVN